MDTESVDLQRETQVRRRSPGRSLVHKSPIVGRRLITACQRDLNDRPDSRQGQQTVYLLLLERPYAQPQGTALAPAHAIARLHP